MDKTSRATQPPRASAPADEGCAYEYLPKFLPQSLLLSLQNGNLEYSPRRPPASKFHKGIEFTPSPLILPGAVLLRAQSLGAAGPNHSDIDPIHIPEISFRT